MSNAKTTNFPSLSFLVKLFLETKLDKFANISLANFVGGVFWLIRGLGLMTSDEPSDVARSPMGRVI